MSRSFLFKLFQGCSSGSDNEEAGDGLSHDPGDKKSGSGSSSDEEVSDTESVGSDEVAKLQTEAADLVGMETEEVCKEFGFCSREWMSNVQPCFDEVEGCRTRIAIIVSFPPPEREKCSIDQCTGTNIQGFPTLALID